MKRQYTPGELALKLVSSLLVTAAATGFLVVLGPRPAPAGAEIYAQLAEVAGFLPRPPGASTTFSEPRPVRLNGQGYHYSVGHARRSVTEILDHYHTQFRQQITATDGTALDPSYRVEGDDMGVVVGLTFGGLNHPGELGARARYFGTSRRFADFGQFHVVAAFAGHETTFLHITPDPDAGVDGLLPTAGGDSPGADIRGLARPPRSRRLLAIDQQHSATLHQTRFYQVPAGGDALRDYGARLEGDGWQLNHLLHDERDVRTSHYVRRDRTEECFVASLARADRQLLALIYRRPAEAR